MKSGTQLSLFRAYVLTSGHSGLACVLDSTSSVHACRVVDYLWPYALRYAEVTPVPDPVMDRTETVNQPYENLVLRLTLRLP